MRQSSCRRPVPEKRGARMPLSGAHPHRRLKAARHLPNCFSTLAKRVPIGEEAFMKFRPLHPPCFVVKLGTNYEFQKTGAALQRIRG